MTQKELDVILDKHQKWLSGRTDSIKISFKKIKELRDATNTAERPREDKE